MLNGDPVLPNHVKSKHVPKDSPDINRFDGVNANDTND
jgi:hypothetical protein